MLTLFSDFLTEFTFPNQQHSAAFYKITAAVFPLALVLTARASRLRWPATIAAGTYMGVLAFMVWILPLFPAQPMLAPIYNPVDRMVPPAFPLLLVLPALGIDLVMRRSARCAAAVSNSGVVEGVTVGKWLRAFGRSDWRLAIGLAVVFLAIFVPVQWFFSAFLLSDAADNWVFARSGHWPYWVEPSEWLNRFWDRSVTPLTAAELAKAFAIAVVS